MKVIEVENFSVSYNGKKVVNDMVKYGYLTQKEADSILK